MDQDTSAVDFAVWLRDNFSPLDKEKDGKWLHKRLWRRDFTQEILDVDDLYKEFKAGIVVRKYF